MKQALSCKSLLAPKFKYSQIIKAGPNIYCSGLVALDNATGGLVGGGVTAQCQKILENLQLLMTEQKLSWDDLVMARIFTTEFDQFQQINQVWEELFNSLDSPPPARTSVGVNALPLNAKVEMEFTFYKSE